MKIIGLTGGSGCGKTTVALYFAKRNIPVLDTDKVARQITEKGEPCLTKLADAFGREIIDADGNLRRKMLAQIVFGETDPQKKLGKHETLNNITHKYVKEKTEQWLKVQATAHENIVVLDVPLLFESGMDKICSLTVGVVADRQTQIARICQRDNLSTEAAEERLNAQHEAPFFRAHCDVIIENRQSTTPKALEQAVDSVLQQLCRMGTAQTAQSDTK